jgi:ribose-phosphate pyrophosphokinase
MTRIVLPFPADIALAKTLSQEIGARLGRLEWHHFPDGESLVTIDDDLHGANVAIVASLRHPDTLAMPLRFAAETAREFGAKRVGLIAPYLGYMRQDRRFHSGEAISASLFARFLSDTFDWLVTADPHLHRNPELDAIYSIPTRRVVTAPLLANWIRENVNKPIVIGPDSESAQWVSEVANLIGCPYQVLQKVRHSDQNVTVSLPDMSTSQARTPVIVDDIASSGRTLIETLGHLTQLGQSPAICVLIHAVFAADAYEKIDTAGAARIVSTNTIAHPSNLIEVTSLIATASAELFEGHCQRKPS